MSGFLNRTPVRRVTLNTLRKVLLSLLLSTACVFVPNDPIETVIASNDEWTVVGVGRLDKADVDNKFNVSRRGQPYVNGAYLHFDSDSFNSEYPIREWVAPNVLGLARALHKNPIHYIVVHNRSASRIKWLRVGAQDFFIVLDLASRASVELPCPDWGGAYGFSAIGAFEDGRRIKTGGSVQGDEPARTVEVLIADTTSSVTIQPK